MTLRGGARIPGVVDVQPVRRVRTAVGTNPAAFAAPEWALVAAIAVTWGSNYLLVEVALRGLRPGLVALIRVCVAVVLLVVIPAARRPIDPRDRRTVALLGVVWVAGPLLLVPVAQQWIDSSLAAMVNATAPLGTMLVTAAMLRRRPRPLHVAGSVVALLGLVVLSVRPTGPRDHAILGIGLVLCSVACYAVGSSLAVPLQQRYGALPLLLRSQVLAAVVLLPVGLASVPSSQWRPGSVAAAVAVGASGSALAFLAVITLVGRVGAPRAAVTLYVVPAVATALGFFILDEAVGWPAVIGLSAIVVGAALASRRELT